MSYDKSKVIEIATNEVGYLEKSKSAYQKNASVLYQKSTGSGYDNYTKYGYEMNQIYPSIMDFPAAWCDAFVDWCFYKAYGVTTAKSLLGGNFDDYTVNSAKMYKDKGALDNTPRVGDQIFFTRNGAYTGCYHTGLVIAVNGNTVTTIEGNTSATGNNIEANGGCVAKKVRSVTKNTLFGHPKYEEAKAVSQYAGIVTASVLNVRTGPGTSNSLVKLDGQIMRLPKGMVVAIDKESNGWGELSGTSYWVSLSYIKKG